VLGVSFGELVVVGLVALLVLGPERIPSTMRSLGRWLGKLRHLQSQVRAHSGIDEALRQEGLPGGLTELRALVRGDMATLRQHFDLPLAEARAALVPDPYLENLQPDPTREYPPEGCDSRGTLPDDLVSAEARPEAPHE